MASVKFIPFSFPNIPQVRMVFTTRKGGNSLAPYESNNLSFDVNDEADDVTRNRQELGNELGLDTWSELIQVHGDILHFDAPQNKLEVFPSEQGDGLATSQTAHPLVMKTADCQPVLVAHKNGKHIAAFHVGWRGNQCCFLISGIKEFCEKYDLDPSDLSAVRGPSLGPNRAEFINFHQDFGAGFDKYYDEKTHMVDLWKLTNQQLMDAGLLEENIFGINCCTYSEVGDFFSYRHACSAAHIGEHGKTGRQMGIIWIEK